MKTNIKITEDDINRMRCWLSEEAMESFLEDGIVQIDGHRMLYIGEDSCDLTYDGLYRTEYRTLTDLLDAYEEIREINPIAEYEYDSELSEKNDEETFVLCTGE